MNFEIECHAFFLCALQTLLIDLFIQQETAVQFFCIFVKGLASLHKVLILIVKQFDLLLQVSNHHIVRGSL